MSGGYYNEIQNTDSKDLLEKIGTLELLQADLESRGLNDAASETAWLIKRLNSINSELAAIDNALGPIYVNKPGNLRNVWRQLDHLNDVGEEAVLKANSAYITEKNKAGLEG